MRRLVVPLALLGVALAGCADSGRLGPYPGAPIILISIDTLRADHLPAYGYAGVATPALDALAASGVVFENAYSHYPLTFPAHTSMLTGLLPPRHGVRDNDGYRFDSARQPYLPRLLAGAGYDTGGFVSSLVLRSETGLGAGFATYDSALALERGASFASAQRSGPETATLALRWLGERTGRPVFVFLHLYEPHAPYTPPEPFRSRHAAAPYDGEVEAADAVVGGFVAQLKRLGLYERAILVVVADHGEGLGDHAEKSHGVFLYRSTLHVPLIVKLPNDARAGTRVARPVGLVDLTPTLAALAGVAVPSDLDGRDLFTEPAPDAPARAIYAESYYPRLHLGWSDLQALYETRWAYVDAPEPELYDLERDASQTHNVLAENRRDYTRLKQRVAELDAPLAEPFPIDAETAAQLAALGYLTSVSLNRSGALPDPKSQGALLAPFEEGLLAFVEERHEDAIRSFRELLAANDQMLDIWVKLGSSLVALDRYEEALPAFRRSFELSGGEPQYALPLAEALVRLGRAREARPLVELARQWSAPDADDVIAQIELAEGHTAEAYARMERVAAEGRATEGIAYRVALARLADARNEEALALLAPFVAKGEAVTLATYARALSELGRQNEALAVLERALAHGPPPPAVEEANGIVLLRLGRAAEARAALARAVAANPSLASAWNTLGVALYQLEGAAPAIAAWQRAVELDPELWDALFNLGLVAAQSGRTAVAREALERFALQAPSARYAADKIKAREVMSRLR